MAVLAAQRMKIIVITGTVVVGVAVGAAVLPLIGFGAGGVAAGSIAAGIHSGIGNVVAGSLFAITQSFAATGGAAVLAAIGGAVFGFFGWGASWWMGKSKETSN